MIKETLSAGDWPYLFAENIREFSWWPQSPFLWLEPYYQITAKIGLEIFHFSWPLIERLFWFWPFLFLVIFCSYRLTRSWLGVLIYATNTYILMIVAGGQMGVAMAYALAPLVFAWLTRKQNFLMAGFLFGLQTMFDPRLALLTAVAAFLYQPRRWRFLFSAGLIAAIFNLFWLIPWLQTNSEAMPTLAEVDFFSFASFSNTISLLHPNWPENIFGKVYFMRPEFLLIPIVAFSSLFSRKGKNLFWAGLILTGAFLAKGVRPPLGEVYYALFNYVPGFSLFRDPTKFYLLIALAYSVLIPRLIGRRRVLSLLFVVFWLFTIRQAVFGQLTGTFQGTEVPQEYLALKEFIQQDDQQAPIFWLPKRQRFGFQSLDHPAIESFILPTKEELQELDIKYVIIPYDSQQEIFLDDYQYSEVKRQEFVDQLDKFDFLEKLELDISDKITIYENRSF